jgi:hypothetical protein
MEQKSQVRQPVPKRREKLVMDGLEQQMFPHFLSGEQDRRLKGRKQEKEIVIIRY